jgi:hypothetical protein
MAAVSACGRRAATANRHEFSLEQSLACRLPAPSATGRAELCPAWAADRDPAAAEGCGVTRPPRFDPQGRTGALSFFPFVALVPSRPGYFRYGIYRPQIRPADWLRPTVM